MSTEAPLAYFESTVFIALVKGEPERVDLCRAALADAEAGRVRALTSALTIAEVVRPTGGFIPPDAEAKIAAFFKHPWIQVTWVDRRVADVARTLAREYGLKPPDAIHVATAQLYKVQVMHTYDDKILAIKDRLGGITIQPPSGQLRFDLGADT